MKRRTPLSVECRPCYYFQQSSSSYSGMSRAELQGHLDDQQNFALYLAAWEEFCAERRAGKRRGTCQSHSTIFS